MVTKNYIIKATLSVISVIPAPYRARGKLQPVSSNTLPLKSLDSGSGPEDGHEALLTYALVCSFLKKLISSFLMPMPFSILISLIGLFLLWFTKRQRTGKIFVSLGMVFMLVFSYSAVSNRLLKPLEKKYDTDTMQLENSLPSENTGSIKFVVVLGGGHISDSKLPITGQIGEETLVRLIEGIRLYRKYPGVKLVLSGGRGFDPVPDAYIMANLAKELGVKEHDILIESESKDTIDEAHLIKGILNNEQFILVTSASICPGQWRCFKRLG